jgi:hypothetical protein
MFEFLANLTNYKPNSFKGKTVKEILAMKSGSVGADFFDPANDQAIAEAGLLPEQLDAIEMLRDSKDKTKVYERCYKNKTQRRKIASPKPVQDQVEAEPVEAPVEAPVESESLEAEAERMAGGGRRSRKHCRVKSHKHKHSSKKHCSIKHKHRSDKHRSDKHRSDKHRSKKHCRVKSHKHKHTSKKHCSIKHMH